MSTCSISFYNHPTCETLVDILWFDSYNCLDKVLQGRFNVHTADIAGDCNLNNGGSVSWGYHPGGEETDYDVYCEECGELIWFGLQTSG